MIEYKSETKYTLGKKKVFVVKNDKKRRHDDFDLIGKNVMIDGKKYLVLGIERFAKQTIEKDEPIGLLVSD